MAPSRLKWRARVVVVAAWLGKYWGFCVLGLYLLGERRENKRILKPKLSRVCFPKPLNFKKKKELKTSPWGTCEGVPQGRSSPDVKCGQLSPIQKVLDIMPKPKVQVGAKLRFVMAFVKSYLFVCIFFYCNDFVIMRKISKYSIRLIKF